MTLAPRRKRRSRRSFAARFGRFWLLALVVLALVAWGGFALAGAPVFRLHALAVTGLEHVSRAEVIARAGIDPRANVWLLDRRAIERRIESIPYVATARVHRRPLGNVWLEIVERSADGCLHARGRTVTIDRTDRVLEAGCRAGAGVAYDLRGRSDVAPGGFVRDPELIALQDDARALAATGDRFRTLRHDAYGGLDAELADGVRVRFGDDRDLARKRALIGPILAQVGTARPIRALDLRAPETPVVEFRVPAITAPKSDRTHYTQGTHRTHHNM